MVRPIINAMLCETMPAESDTRAPYTRRAQTSRPWMSVPSQCDADGPWS